MKNYCHCYTTINLIILFIILSISNISNAQTPPDTSSSSPDDNDYALEGSKVSPSMAMIVILLVLGFFITGCVSIYIQQCANDSSLGDPTAINAQNVNPLRANMRGLDQSVLDTFPTFVYSDVKDLKFGKETLECAVCLNEFEEHETLRLLPKCDHVFHSECIDAWLTGHSTCPVCRANLVPGPTQSSIKEESHHETNESGPNEVLEVSIEPHEVPKGRVPRSHSTGHSLACPRDDRERYTLRLPDEVRKQLMVAQPKFKRTFSLIALPRVSSSKRGYRGGGSGSGGGGDGSGSSRYGRFFGRSFKWTTRNNGDGDGSKGKRFFGTVVTPVEAVLRLPV